MTRLFLTVPSASFKGIIMQNIPVWGPQPGHIASTGSKLANARILLKNVQYVI